MIFTNHKIIFFILFVALAIQIQNSYGDSNEVTVTIKTAGTDTKPLDGMWIEIKSADDTVQSGFSPLSYNATASSAYTAYVSDYGNYVFDHWDDGNTSYFRTIQPTSDIFLVAYYRDKSINETHASSDSQAVPTPFLPDWLRDAARSWLDGNLNDGEFLASLQQLVDQKILSPPPQEQPKKQEGFSNVQCTKGERHVEMIGKYTNGDTPYAVVSIRMILYDDEGNILASNAGTISNLGAHESRYFNVITRYHLEYASCDAQVDNVIPK